MKLHQLLAVLPTVKTRTKKALTELYQTAQKPGLFKGLSRAYSPREEGDYVYPKDIIEGTWSLMEFSGALPADVKKRLVERVEGLSIAVVKAREAANAIEVKNLDLATPIFDYLFARIN